jgi:arylsulfatase A-like enzyme
MVVLLTSTGGTAQSKSPRTPNVIFILADDLGYGDLSSYGQKKFSTPNIDRLAAEGMRFTQFYAGSTVCAPSRCALMTGLHTGHCRVRGNAPGGGVPLLPEDVTVAEVLKQAGYRTAAYGKWGLGLADTSGAPTRQGFDEWFGYLDQTHAHFYYTDHLWKNLDKVAVDKSQYTHDLFARSALRFVESSKDKPFFLYLAFTIPHASLQVPEDSLARYRGKYPETPFPEQHYTAQPTPNAAVAAMIDRMDSDVGRLMELLKTLGIDRNTVVFFSSDNGPHKEGGRDPEFFQSSGPLRGIKRDLYEGGIRVPMIVRWPAKIKPGSVSDFAGAFWDFLPTAAEISGRQSPKKLDGISILPVLLGKTRKPHPHLYWEFHEKGFHQAIRMGNWKAVRHGPGKPLELYDLVKDLAERNDVADRHPDVVAKMESILLNVRTESDRFPVPVVK